jgi:hypothetical protein
MLAGYQVLPALFLVAAFPALNKSAIYAAGLIAELNFRMLN